MSQRIWFHRYCYPTQCLISASSFSPHFTQSLLTPPPQKKFRLINRKVDCECVPVGRNGFQKDKGIISLCIGVGAEEGFICCLSGLLHCLHGKAGDMLAASRPPSHLKIKPGVKTQQIKRCKTRI